VEQRRLGQYGPQVSAIGLGCMSIGIADVYTSSVQDDTKAVELIHHALDLGISFFDTANIYGDSEIKVGKALVGRRDDVVTSRRRVGVTGSLRIFSIAGRMKRNRERRPRLGEKRGCGGNREGPSHPAVGTNAGAEGPGDRSF
jgi:predicted aldo/keto reductase-like oxidoreductase